MGNKQTNVVELLTQLDQQIRQYKNTKRVGVEEKEDFTPTPTPPPPQKRRYGVKLGHN